jgi:hypothetical protein
LAEEGYGDKAAGTVTAWKDREVELKFPDRTLTFTRRSYVIGFVLPNFYFHVTTTYDLLRHKGAPS